MPDPSEFEEKEYEMPLYRELGATAPLWTPGQVLEGHLGFDGALSVANTFWAMVDQPVVSGVRLARYGLSPMIARLAADSPAATEELPDFSLNLFLQAKRPVVYREPPRSLVDLGLREPMFFFEVTDHQQRLLEALARHLGGQAHVSYACAAFRTKRELFSLSERRALASNSTFPPVMKLVSHDRWAYDAPGATGVGFSEPERLDSAPLLDRVLELARRHPHSQRRSPPDEVKGETEGGAGESARRGLIAKEMERRAEALVPPLLRIWEAVSAALRDTDSEHAAEGGLILDRADAFDAELPQHARLVVRISTVLAHLEIAWLAIGPALRSA